MFKLHRLTTGEQFDIETMRYFIPRNKLRTRITKQDIVCMADLSSKGIQPSHRTPGFINLLWGKTYRDEQITSYRNDIQLGYITKYEIISSFPKHLQPWIESKIKDVPYDVDGHTSRIFVDMYRKDIL